MCIRDSANTAPTATPVALAPIAEDSGAITITQADLLANAGDVDGDVLTAINLENTTGNGTLSDNDDGTWDYTPDGDGDTNVSFSYRITDGTNIVAATATLDITPVNDAPVLVDTFNTNEDVAIEGNVFSNPSDTLTVQFLFTSPSRGILALNQDGSFIYIPDPNFSGTDTFIFSRIADGPLPIPVLETVNINVEPVNDAPVISFPGSQVTNEDTALTLSLIHI